MTAKTWQSRYADRLRTAEEALQSVRDGHTVYVGSGAGEPLALTRALLALAPRLNHVELLQIAGGWASPTAERPDLVGPFRVRTILGGRLGTEEGGGGPDALPLRLCDLPRALSSDLLRIDVALVQVSPPDEGGLASLGVSVDAARAAVESARLVIAQVNPHMPVTLGDSLVAVDALHVLVDGAEPLLEMPRLDLDPVSLTIGRYVAGLVRNGSMLHVGGGRIGAATLRHLETREDLGVHTDVLTDDVLRLLRSRAVTHRTRRTHHGATVATLALGSRALYAALDRNPVIHLLPVDEVTDPVVIGQNEDMVAVLPVDEIDLTGLARVDLASGPHGLPSHAEFLEGARRSKGGFTILALPSTTEDGSRSRIVARAGSHGLLLDRAGVHYVVTEYGTVNLHGLSIRERAVALLSVAHPEMRAALLEEAKALGLVGREQTIPTGPGSLYPHAYEFTHVFPGPKEVFFRPVQPSDARRLQRLFYSLSPEAVRLRYHGTIRSMPYAVAQRLAAVDYAQDVAIVGLVGPRENPEIVAEGRYLYNPSSRMGEFDIVVREDHVRQGIGTFLANYLGKVAYARGLSGVYAEVIQDNAGTMALLRRAWPTATTSWDSGVCRFTVRFPSSEVERPKDSIVVYSGRVADFSYGDDHPFRPDRARIALQMIRDNGFLNEPWMRVEEPTRIPKERLYESHLPEYVDALEEANEGIWKESFLRFHLGGDDCPVFPGLFDYVLLYTSATIAAVDGITERNANVVFNPVGGFHHGNRAYAEGFCYVNDAVVAIDLLLARGHRVAYVDVDAHHGNGVQDAYWRDDRALVVSVHESGKTLYPWCGFETEIGEGIGKGYTVNVPLPAGSDDEAFERAFARVVVPAVRAFAPTVVVCVVGADMHRLDPLAHLKLTNNGMVARHEGDPRDEPPPPDAGGRGLRRPGDRPRLVPDVGHREPDRGPARLHDGGGRGLLRRRGPPGRGGDRHGLPGGGPGEGGDPRRGGPRGRLPREDDPPLLARRRVPTA